MQERGRGRAGAQSKQEQIIYIYLYVLYLKISGLKQIFRTFSQTSSNTKTNQPLKRIFLVTYMLFFFQFLLINQHQLVSEQQTCKASTSRRFNLVQDESLTKPAADYPPTGCAVI